jgi:hypothetical protein
MDSESGVRLVADALNRLGIDFLVVGSFSSNIYTTPRSTLDADFVVEADADIRAFACAIADAFRMEQQVGFETKLMTTKYEFYLRSTDFKVELFLLSDDPHDRLRFDNRIKATRGDTTLYFPRAEDVIIQKLRWGRKKDLLDVTEILKAQAGRLDQAYLDEWTSKHSTNEKLDALRKEAEA